MFFRGNLRVFSKRYSKEHLWAAALYWLFYSENLLTIYEQLSYFQFNRNLSFCVALLAKGWFTLHKKFNQDLQLVFYKQKIDSCYGKKNVYVLILLLN